MVLYCIIIGLAVYYLALWGWYRRVAVNNRTAPQPERKKRENTASLVGESHFRSGLMRTTGTSWDTSRKRLKMILHLRPMLAEKTKKPTLK